MRNFSLKQNLKNVLTVSQVESIESAIEQISGTPLDAKVRYAITTLEIALVEPIQRAELCEP